MKAEEVFQFFLWFMGIGGMGIIGGLFRVYYLILQNKEKIEHKEKSIEKIKERLHLVETREKEQMNFLTDFRLSIQESLNELKTEVKVLGNEVKHFVAEK